MKKLLLSVTIVGLVLFSTFAQPGTVKSSLKIGALSNNFVGTLSDGDFFGSSVAYLNDIDGDGIGDIAITAFQDDDGGFDKGAIWILLMNSDGTIKTYKKISDTQGGFDALIDAEDHLGADIAAIGDIDNDGICDIAVGAGADDDGGNAKGAVYIIFLNSDGSTKDYHKISETSGGFNTSLGDRAGLGNSIALIGDLDKDGVNDIAVGAPRNAVNSISKGAIWVMFLNADGTVKNKTYITEGNGGFSGTLEKDGFFGTCIEGIGDLNNDGINDIIVSAGRENDGGSNYGALYVLFLNSNGTVKETKKISKTNGLSALSFANDDYLGQSLAYLKDIDGDDVGDIAVGMPGSGNSSVKGKIVILFLKDDGSVKSFQEISETSGDFYGNISAGDQFAWSLSPIYDFNGDCIMDLIVGSKKDDDGGTDRGAIWLLYLDGVANGLLENNSPLSNVIVYPNPAMDELNISGIVASELVELCVYDIQGKLYYRLSGNFHSSSELNIKTENFLKGLYTIKLKYKTKTEQYKFFKY